MKDFHLIGFLVIDRWTLFGQSNFSNGDGMLKSCWKISSDLIFSFEVHIRKMGQFTGVKSLFILDFQRTYYYYYYCPIIMQLNSIFFTYDKTRCGFQSYWLCTISAIYSETKLMKKFTADEALPFKSLMLDGGKFPIPAYSTTSRGKVDRAVNWNCV